MTDAYIWLKFIHVASIAVWFGGFAALGIMNTVASRKADKGEVAHYLLYGQALGARVAGPASGLALIAGVAAMIVGRTGMQPWIAWGFVVFALFAAVGVLGMRPVTKRLIAATEAPPDTGEIRRLLRRQRVLLLTNLLLLLTAVWAMVFKPV